MTRVIEGDLIATTASITIVVARFNELVVDSLLKGALDALKRHGVQESNVTIVKVPGAFELKCTWHFDDCDIALLHPVPL